MRIRKETNRVIFHHSGGADVPASEVDSWHKAKGYDMIGYYQIVHKDGVPENGRGMEYEGAHASGRNTDSIGICIMGNFNEYPPTAMQLETCRAIYYSLCKRYNKKLIIEFHRWLSEENPCPGRWLDRNALQIQLTHNHNQYIKKQNRFICWILKIIQYFILKLRRSK